MYCSVVGSVEPLAVSNADVTVLLQKHFHNSETRNRKSIKLSPTRTVLFSLQLAQLAATAVNRTRCVPILVPLVSIRQQLKTSQHYSPLRLLTLHRDQKLQRSAVVSTPSHRWRWNPLLRAQGTSHNSAGCWLLHSAKLSWKRSHELSMSQPVKQATSVQWPIPMWKSEVALCSFIVWNKNPTYLASLSWMLKSAPEAINRSTTSEFLQRNNAQMTEQLHCAHELSRHKHNDFSVSVSFQERKFVDWIQLAHPPQAAAWRQVLPTSSVQSTSKPSVFASNFFTHSKCPFNAAMWIGNMPTAPRLQKSNRSFGGQCDADELPNRWREKHLGTGARQLKLVCRFFWGFFFAAWCWLSTALCYVVFRGRV